ncbi:MAG: CBS domain-containing protein, partial [bacterium]
MNCPSCGHENIDGIDRCENCLASFRQLDIPSVEASESFAQSVMEDNLSHLDYEPPVFVAPGDPAIDVARRMKEASTGCALVLEGNKLVGIFTEHDVLLRLTSAVSDKMSDKLQFVEPASERISATKGVSTGSGAGSPSGQPARGAGSNRVVEDEVSTGSGSDRVEQITAREPEPRADILLSSEIPLEELRADEMQFAEMDTSASPSPRVRADFNLPVKELMSKNPETLHEKDSVAEALNRMSMGRYRHLPVRKSDGSYAVASIKSVLNYIAKEDW